MSQEDPWKKYDKEMQGKLRENSQLVNAINNMRDRGYSKEKTQQITGAPYEIVDKLFNHRGKRGIKPDTPVDERDD